MGRTVVVGVGTGCRHDDGVGPRVASRLAALDDPGVDVAICEGECVELLELWAGKDLAIIIDAMAAIPAHPGRIRRIDPSRLSALPTAASSHSLGVAEALRLGGALDRLPARLVVFAVEAARLDPGIGLSTAVAAAVPQVIDAVRAEVYGDTRIRGRSSDPPPAEPSGAGAPV